MPSVSFSLLHGIKECPLAFKIGACAMGQKEVYHGGISPQVARSSLAGASEKTRLAHLCRFHPISLAKASALTADEQFGLDLKQAALVLDTIPPAIYGSPGFPGDDSEGSKRASVADSSTFARQHSRFCSRNEGCVPIRPARRPYCVARVESFQAVAVF